jgi:hypothetical protein
MKSNRRQRTENDLIGGAKLSTVGEASIATIGSMRLYTALRRGVKLT